MRERLDRLMKKLPDGSWKCVGYMRMEKGIIEHMSPFSAMEFWENIIDAPEMYIPHDRIDQYTGVDLADGTKVFENDKLTTDMGEYLVIMKNGSWQGAPLKTSAACYGSLATSRIYSGCKKGNFKITGINGVPALDK